MLTSIIPIVLLSGVVLVVAYFTYGRLLARWLGIDPARNTPAVELADGNDFVPASAPVVLGGHFTAIAAAGPVVGPIIAAQLFGWLPALIWILVGSILIGGVHDASSLLASIRHRAASITQVVRQHMSRPAYVTFLLFVWLSLLYVVVAFTDLVSGSFSKLESISIASTDAVTPLSINGGAVAVGATAYLLASLLSGLVLRFTKVPWWVVLIAAVAGLGVIIGMAPAIAAWLADHGLSFMASTADKGRTDSIRSYWNFVLLAYCFVASITPMWLLLQPRGLIGATFLYATLAFGLAAVAIGIVGGSGDALAIRWPAFTGFGTTPTTWLFPFLFITVACGACSGFHSIVASGTTSKQVRNERDVKPVAYGGMLLEAMVAVFALCCVMIIAPAAGVAPGTAGKVGTPDAIYARGIATFMNATGVPIPFAVMFALLAFSSFVFDTLDVCTRLGRYVLQELTGLRGRLGGAVATLLTLAAPAVYLASAPPGSFMKFWTIFGTSNQLLAALTLVGVSVWLWRTGRPVWFALVPAVFMVCSTLTALFINGRLFLAEINVSVTAIGSINLVVAVVLMGLAGLIIFEAVRVMLVSRRREAVVAAE